MADETSTDKPLADLAAAENKINPPVLAQDPPSSISLEPSTVPDRYAPADEPTSAIDRLRAFEDKHFGQDAVRINGRIERGSGSLYQMVHPSVREQHARIEKLIEVEQKLADAHAALIAADTEHEMAEQAVIAAERDADASDE